VGRLEAFNHNLIFWDLGGQSGLRSIWDKYYDDSHAVMYVVDAASQARFDESKQVGESVGVPAHRLRGGGCAQA
jgi:ADP-ribosylation factor related protein 1